MSARDSDRFVVAPGTPFSLDSRNPADTSGAPGDKKATQKVLEDLSEELLSLQDRLYAESGQALLVVLQAMDAGGKDGTVKHVFAGSNPQGVRVTSFKQPTPEELAHDFLWRAHVAAPRRGFIGIFNRSYYEDVLVGRVRKLAPQDDIKKRYDQINAFEKILFENGTTVLKFMLHISKKEQRERLQARLDEPQSRWKFNPSDLDDRKLWDKFSAAYEIMLDKCSTPWAPWHVIPADRKWARNAAIAAIVRETLEEMNPQYPKPDWDPKSFVLK